MSSRPTGTRPSPRVATCPDLAPSGAICSGYQLRPSVCLPKPLDALRADSSMTRDIYIGFPSPLGPLNPRLYVDPTVSPVHLSPL